MRGNLQKEGAMKQNGGADELLFGFKTVIDQH